VAKEDGPPRPTGRRRAGATDMADTETKLKAGDMAPDFTLTSDAGASVRLSDLRGKRVIVYFYPKDDTPGCTIQACGLRDAYPQIAERNGVVLGISPDDEKSHQQFKTKFDLPFTLLVDPDHQVAELYGAWGENSAYGRTYTGIIRSQFIVDEQGRLADVQLPIKANASAERALHILES
jgi:peroxiredoxin Q/BCP